ncbi:peptidylprolyl isomerase [Ignatzschineria ureiclastica]|uniref:Peptidyl-prolyl cis-trans isomerase n=1 Tax=Ignatzschineria ureiclastica TaxID=472582 RepID=A0A2U2ACY2_9GAMM|nr:peptidylprolyl isomerase [Ignatzschineria ureiclastica]GGZ99177.1 peptidyl-prolyl cis-trans isomerase [Ignatzschineria ureiclastica]
MKKLMLAGALMASLMTGVTMAADEVKAPPLYVEMDTNLGNVVFELDEAKAPVTVENFKNYVDDGFYDGLIFHRVIDGFMVQGGGFDADMKQKKTAAPIKIESDNGLKNVRGSIAMARTMDPNSATSQFFINTQDNTFLDYPGQDGYGYTVFGKVVEGMDVIDKMEKVKTTSKAMHQDVPAKPIVIESMKFVEKP